MVVATEQVEPEGKVAMPKVPSETKLKLECWYCPAVFTNLTSLIEHFEDKHRQEAEYIEPKLLEQRGIKGDE